MRATRESPPNKKGLVPERFRDQPLAGLSLYRGLLVLRQHLSSEPAQATLRHDLAEQIDYLGVVGFAGIARKAGVGQALGAHRLVELHGHRQQKALAGTPSKGLQAGRTHSMLAGALLPYSTAVGSRASASL